MRRFADDRFPYVGLIGSSDQAGALREAARRGRHPEGPASRRLSARSASAGSGRRRRRSIAAATAAELLVRDEALRAAAAPQEMRACCPHGPPASLTRSTWTPSRTAGTEFRRPERRCRRWRLSASPRISPTLRANDNVDFAIHPGEIHALLGENGAGKSTLVKILYGALQPTAGEIRWQAAQPVTIANPAAARRLGIGMVFQHFSLFDSLTVAENICAGALRRDPSLDGLKTSIAGRLDRIRPAAPPRLGRRRPVRRRAPAGRDRPLPAPGAAAHHHGRADLGADAAGGRRPVRHPEAARRGGLLRPLHQPSPRGGARHLPPRHDPPPRQGGRPSATRRRRRRSAARRA